MPRTLLFDRSCRMRLRFSGPQSVATLNGLVTNDVAALAQGEGTYAAALTAKGKMVADLRIFMCDDGLLVDTSSRGGEGLRAMFRKYVNPRVATITDVTDTLGDLGVFGDAAAQIVAGATNLSQERLVRMASYAQERATVGNTSLLVAHVPDLGVDGYDLFVPSGHVSVLRDALLSAGASRGDTRAWHRWRVAAGWPAWGVDMNEETLPQEANLEALHGVSYDKGCYVGQETVARIHFRGHVNRTLRRLAMEGGVEPPSRSALTDDQGTVVGDVRSTAVRTDGAASAVLGIGMVRREVEAGAVLTARWSGGAARVRVLGPADGNARGATD